MLAAVRSCRSARVLAIALTSVGQGDGTSLALAQCGVAGEQDVDCLTEPLVEIEPGAGADDLSEVGELVRIEVIGDLVEVRLGALMARRPARLRKSVPDG